MRLTWGQEVDLLLEGRHQQCDPRIRPAPRSQIGRQREVAILAGRAAQVCIAEVHIVQRQEHCEGGEIADVHAHCLAGRGISATGQQPCDISIRYAWQIYKVASMLQHS